MRTPAKRLMILAWPTISSNQSSIVALLLHHSSGPRCLFRSNSSLTESCLTNVTAECVSILPLVALKTTRLLMLSSHFQISFSFRFLHQNPVCISLLHTYHMSSTQPP
jgi:hypothetical protein